jgi:hypothetical protein
MAGRRGFLLPAGLVVVLLLCGLPGAAQRKGPESGKAARPAVFTGCVDQDGEDYLLREPANLAEVAILEPEGMSRDGLAKFVGQTVRVRGVKSSEGGKTKLRFRTIETVAEGCSPAKEQ